MSRNPHVNGGLGYGGHSAPGNIQGHRSIRTGAQPARHLGPVFDNPSAYPPRGLELVDGVPSQRGLMEIIARAVRGGVYGDACIQRVQPTELVHPGYRTIVKEIVSRGVVHTATGSVAAGTLRDAQVVAPTLMGPGEANALTYEVESGRSAQLRSLSIDVENGDPEALVWTLWVEGGAQIFSPRSISPDDCCRDMNVWALIEANERLTLRVRNRGTTDPSPYLVTIKAMIWDWQVGRSSVDSLHGSLGGGGLCDDTRNGFGSSLL